MSSNKRVVTACRATEQTLGKIDIIAKNHSTKRGTIQAMALEFVTRDGAKDFEKFLRKNRQSLHPFDFSETP